MKAVITIEDKGDDVNINVDFGEEGVSNEAYAHYLAMSAMETISELIKKYTVEDLEND